MRTATGHVLSQDVRAGMELLSRDEWDASGAVVPKVVEEVFVREGLVVEVQVKGVRIRTTAEHPLYRLGDGWTAAQELKAGDTVRLEDGWATVEAVIDTGSWETVYNFRVADFHTYFVGCDEWGWAVWAHNARNYAELEKAGLADTIAAELAILQKGGVTHLWPALEAKYGAISDKAKSALRHKAAAEFGYLPPSTKRGPKTADDGEKALQLRASAAMTEVLLGEVETYGKIKILGGGRLPDLTPYKPEIKVPGSGPAVKSPDFTLEGRMTRQDLQRISSSLRYAIRDEFTKTATTLDDLVGQIRIYGIDRLPARKSGYIPVNIGLVKKNGVPLSDELDQILSYRASKFPLIHAAYDRRRV